MNYNNSTKSAGAIPHLNTRWIHQYCRHRAACWPRLDIFTDGGYTTTASPICVRHNLTPPNATSATLYELQCSLMADMYDEPPSLKLGRLW